MTRDVGRLWYFEDIWPVELAAIDARRSGRREAVRPLAPLDEAVGGGTPRSPDPGRVFGRTGGAGASGVDPRRPDGTKMRPQPVPCDATGLALSGGGIRSAAVCLGALQALSTHRRLESIDYLSTVSGGGYIGACLSAGMSGPDGAFPFGTDVRDTDAVSWLRNYSNYLLPRGRTGLRNWAEATAIILRGLLANAVVALTLLLFAALLTVAAYPDRASLGSGSFVIALARSAWGLAAAFAPDLRDATCGSWCAVLDWRFLASGACAGLLAAVLLAWAVSRSVGLGGPRGDTRGPFLATARALLVLAGIMAVADLQPWLVATASDLLDPVAASDLDARLGALGKTVSLVLGVVAPVVTWFSGALGNFLKTTERKPGKATLLLRLLSQAVIVVAACVLPLALWACYLLLTAVATMRWQLPPAVHDGVRSVYAHVPILSALRPAPTIVDLYALAWVTGTLVSLLFRANGYSLHRFYRDRLSTAFLFRAIRDGVAALDGTKLSELRGGRGPYHIVNAALNVQGSAEANRRGRDADFFIFTPDFVGSDLTFYAGSGRRPEPAFSSTLDAEALDPSLDLGTAMAISGAAVSANMGSNTIRLLSPTLALLNVRLGYWLANPRFRVASSGIRRTFHTFGDLFWSKLYLLDEMFNLQDEKSPVLLLTDGGHIENLGLYELLKRGCGTIIVIDAEADPELAFPSLLKLERYARLDFGVRIELPWERIADRARQVEHLVEAGVRPCLRGPHCAVGRIVYADGSLGTLVYFKPTVTGDEKDYVLDYKRRHPDFPHEGTGDQFFSEEQFEMYRALGFHMVDGFFTRGQEFAWERNLHGFADEEAAFADVAAAIPRRPSP